MHDYLPQLNLTECVESFLTQSANAVDWKPHTCSVIFHTPSKEYEESRVAPLSYRGCDGFKSKYSIKLKSKQSLNLSK